MSLGLIAWAADRVPGESAVPIAAGAGNLPSHWLAMAYLIGVVSQRPLPAALWATLGLALAVVVYYYAIDLAGDRPSADLLSAARAWLVVSVFAGPVFGFFGAVWSNGRSLLQVWSVALLAGVFAGEALFLFGTLDLLSLSPSTDTRTAFATLELAVACALPFIMLRETRDRLLALGGTLVFGLLAYVAIEVVFDAVREALRPV